MNEDLTVDPPESTNFHDEESVRATQLNTSERNSASTITSHANETSFNSPNDPDTVTVRERKASKRRTSPRAETTEVRSKRSDEESEASQSDKEESDETLLDIEYDDDEEEEYESQDSGSDYEPYD